MILGIGTDIIEVARIQRLADNNPKFLDRVFTDDELRYCRGKKNSAQHLAARFAAKEAFFKALGQNIGWKSVGLVNEPSGKPRLDIRSSESLPFSRSYVSISHLKEYAVAVVVLEV